MVKSSIKNIISGNARVKGVISEIIAGIATLRAQNLVKEIKLNVGITDLISLTRYLDFEINVYCVECGDYETVKCFSCGDTRFSISDIGIQCKKCGSSIGQDVVCLNDHKSSVMSNDELITFYPTDAFISIVELTLSRSGQAPYNRHEESYFIRGTTLYIFGSIGTKVLYLPQDIPEFRNLETVTLPSPDDDVFSVLAKYKERCAQMEQRTCARCVDNRVGEHCFLRLFGLYDTRYIPRPHHGHEFGDVSLDVTIDGRRNQIMVILLKSRVGTGRPITINQALGAELNTQFENYLHNPSVNIVCVGVPQKIDDGFKARLRQKIINAGKKLMFLEADDFAKMLLYVTQEYGITLDQL
jgi:hypothetical protein